jgi:glycosyltransferase involved in cell wall biosynthesis
LLLDIWEQYGDRLPGLRIRGDVEEIFSEYPQTRDRIAAHPKIKVVEPLDEPAMQSLYRHARLLVNPSLYEGFGLPNLEAMANGCPLLVSDSEVFREICGPYARYADPHNAQEWAEKIIQMLNEPVSPGEMQAARNRARMFSEEREGGKLLKLLYP